MKEFRFINDQAYREFVGLPGGVRRRFATSLNAAALDQGLPEQDYVEGDNVSTKMLSGSGMKGVVQLSINGKPAYRVVYCAKFGERLYVLHSWTKTAEGRDKAAMETLEKRYKAMLAELREEGLI